MMRKIGIVSKPDRADLPAIVEELTAWLESKGVEYECDQVTTAYLGREGGFPREGMPEGFDLVIVLGGDGTLLSAARAVGPRETPLLAVNLGGLGFMMTTRAEELFDELGRVLEGNFAVQARRVLEAEVVRESNSLQHYFALNDVVINKLAIARLLHLDVFVDEEFVCRYRADGLIISTPTGSTAYSLAAGGPIMFPSVQAICLSPICPHTLSNRPVVVPETSRVEVLIQDGDHDGSTFLTVDGQVGLDLQSQDRVRTQCAAHRVRVIQPRRLSFFDVLRTKMNWGER
jgi:NAD+ kinase